MTTKDFQTFKIYMKVARELQANNAIVSYYLKTYALNKAVEYLKIERAQGIDIKEKTVVIKDWLQDLEGLKALLSSELSNKEQCKQTYKNFAFDLYAKSDDAYRKGQYTRDLAKKFLYVSVLFDAWELFSGQAADVKAEKNYANEARFKIIDAIDKGQVPNNANAGAWDHVRSGTTPNGNAQEPGHKRKDTPIDPLAKLDFALTESIVVPKSTIDNFIGGTRPDVKITVKNVLDGLMIEQPKGGKLPPTDSPNTNKNNKTPNSPFGLPIGQSIRLEDTENPDRMQTEGPSNNNPTVNAFNQNPNFVQYNNQSFQQHIPTNNLYPSMQQGQHPQSHFPARPGYHNVQTGYQGHVQHFPQSTFGGNPNMQNPQNQIVLREIQNNKMSVDVNNMDKGKGGEVMQKCQEAKDFCLRAASELDFVKVKEAKEKIYKALSLLEQLENKQE